MMSSAAELNRVCLDAVLGIDSVSGLGPARSSAARLVQSFQATLWRRRAVSACISQLKSLPPEPSRLAFVKSCEEIFWLLDSSLGELSRQNLSTLQLFHSTRVHALVVEWLHCTLCVKSNELAAEPAGCSSSTPCSSSWSAKTFPVGWQLVAMLGTTLESIPSSAACGSTQFARTIVLSFIFSAVISACASKCYSSVPQGAGMVAEQASIAASNHRYLDVLQSQLRSIGGHTFAETPSDRKGKVLLLHLISCLQGQNAPASVKVQVQAQVATETCAQPDIPTDAPSRADPADRLEREASPPAPSTAIPTKAEPVDPNSRVVSLGPMHTPTVVKAELYEAAVAGILAKHDTAGKAVDKRFAKAAWLIKRMQQRKESQRRLLEMYDARAKCSSWLTVSTSSGKEPLLAAEDALSSSSRLDELDATQPAVGCEPDLDIATSSGSTAPSDAAEAENRGAADPAREEYDAAERPLEPQFSRNSPAVTDTGAEAGADADVEAEATPAAKGDNINAMSEAEGQKGRDSDFAPVDGASSSKEAKGVIPAKNQATSDRDSSVLARGRLAPSWRLSRHSESALVSRLGIFDQLEVQTSIKLLGLECKLLSDNLSAEQPCSPTRLKVDLECVASDRMIGLAYFRRKIRQASLSDVVEAARKACASHYLGSVVQLLSHNQLAAPLPMRNWATAFIGTHSKLLSYLSDAMHSRYHKWIQDQIQRKLRARPSGAFASETNWSDWWDLSKTAASFQDGDWANSLLKGGAALAGAESAAMKFVFGLNWDVQCNAYLRRYVEMLQLRTAHSAVQHFLHRCRTLKCSRELHCVLFKLGRSVQSIESFLCDRLKWAQDDLRRAVSPASGISLQGALQVTRNYTTILYQSSFQCIELPGEVVSSGGSSSSSSSSQDQNAHGWQHTVRVQISLSRLLETCKRILSAMHVCVITASVADISATGDPRVPGEATIRRWEEEIELSRADLLRECRNAQERQLMGHTDALANYLSW